MKTAWVALAMVGSIALASASPVIHTVGATQTIYQVNVANNNEVPLWSTGFPTSSLAISPSGSLYSADPNGVVFDVTNPFALPVGPTGYTQIGDLDYAPGGLWGFSNATQDLFFFDLGTTTVTYSVNLSIFAAGTVTGVAYDPFSGSVFLSAHAALNADKLYVVPPAATSATFVGNMAHADAFSYISDIDFDGAGTLYAMTWFHRDFYTVNPFNGATGFISNGPHRDVNGMATDASVVPEPGTLLSLFAGAAYLARRRKRSVA